MPGLALRPPLALLPHALATPVITLAAVLLITAAAAFLASRFIPRPITGGLGCLAGTVFLVGLTLPPRHEAEKLPALLLAAFACAALVATPRFTRLRHAILATFALAAGWWLAGDPAVLGPGALRAAVAAAWLLGLALLLPEEAGWSIAAASFALFAALHAVGAAAIWPLLAVIPAAGCITAPARAIVPPPPTKRPAKPPATARRKRGSTPAKRKGPPKRGAARPATTRSPPPATPLPAALALAVIAAAAVAASDPARRPFAPADLVPLAPLAAIWLMARLHPKLRRLGRTGAAIAASLCVALVALVSFSAAALTGLR